MDKYQVWVEPVEVPAPAGSVIYVVYVIHLQAVTWSFVLTRITYVLVLKGFTVYLHFSQIYISKIMFNQIQYRGYCYEGEYLTNLGRIKVGVGLGVTNLAILL